MKKSITYVTMLCLAMIPLLSGSDYSGESQQTSMAPKYQLPEYTVSDIHPPTPLKMVAPRINRLTRGREVVLEFQVSASGRAYDLGQRAFASEGNPRDLESVMRAALRHWRFEPARDSQGNPVSVKVALPVRLVRETKAGVTTAQISLAKPTVVANLER